MRKLFVVAAVLVWTAAAVAQQEHGTNAPQQERSMGMQHQPGAMTGDTNKQIMTSQQIADIFRNIKHSLSDSISVAERNCNGKAAYAFCCLKSQSELENMRMGMSQNPAERSQNPTERQNPSEMGRTPQPGTTAQQKPVCMVTCLVDNNRLVEVTVDAENGQVLGKRDVQTIAFYLPEGTMGTRYGADLGRPGEPMGGSEYATREGGDIEPVQYQGEESRGQQYQGQPYQGEKMRPKEYTGKQMSDEMSMPNRWTKGNDVIGKAVKNSQGEDLGKIEDLAVDPNSGRIIYAVLSFGGFLGLGEKYFAIPWDALELTGDAKNFVLNIDKNELKHAPGFDKAHWPNLADERYATEVFQFYHQTPYWGQGGRTEANVRVTAQNYNERWNAMPTSFQKASDLIGKDVRNSNEDLGKLHDLVIDPDSGRVMYGVLAYRGKYFPIPWNSISMTPDAKYLVVNIDKSQFTDDVAFDKNSWPNFTDQRWAAETYRHYGVEPYWQQQTAARR